MDRRKFIHLLSTVGLIHGKRMSHKEDDTENWCGVNYPDSDIAPIPSDSEPAFVVNGSTKDVNVYWKPNSYFKDFDYGNVYALGFIGGKKIVLNEKQQNNITTFILMHELAHTLGYNHGDGGIVNIDVGHSDVKGDRNSSTTELEDSTYDVANIFDAYRFINDWNVNELGYLGQEFASSECGIKQLQIAGRKFALDSEDEDVYIKHSHNGMGGVYNNEHRVDPTNTYRGHFYTEDNITERKYE